MELTGGPTDEVEFDDAPLQSAVNVMTLTFIHDVLSGQLYATGTFPLICDPSSGQLVKLRELLIAEFDRVTKLHGDARKEVWGEWSEGLGEELQREGLQESAPKLVLPS